MHAGLFPPGDGDQLNHAGYIGSLTTNILLLTVIAIYLVFRWEYFNLCILCLVILDLVGAIDFMDIFFVCSTTFLVMTVNCAHNVQWYDAYYCHASYS